MKKTIILTFIILAGCGATPNKQPAIQADSTHAAVAPPRVELNYPLSRDFPGVKGSSISWDLLTQPVDKVTHVTSRDNSNDSIIDVRSNAYDAVIEVTSISGGARVTVSTSLNNDSLSKKWLNAVSTDLKTDGE